MIDDILELVLDLGTEIRGSFVKVLGWLLIGLGLFILGEPTLNTGFLTDKFAEATFENNMIGSVLMGIGAVIMSGLPNLSSVWEKVEYGVPLLAFFTGVTFIYINAYSLDAFVQNLLGYSVIASISVMFVGIVKLIYSE